MATRYAEGTDVTEERSRGEIERLLTRRGCTAFAYGWQGSEAVLRFELRGRQIHFAIPMPAVDSPAVKYTPGGNPRTSATEIAKALAGEKRRRWRVLLLMIKSQLEAIDLGLLTLDQAFLAQTLLPNGRTAGEWLTPQIDRAIASGQMPPLLPEGRG